MLTRVEDLEGSYSDLLWTVSPVHAVWEPGSVHIIASHSVLFDTDYPGLDCGEEITWHPLDSVCSEPARQLQEQFFGFLAGGTYLRSIGNVCHLFLDSHLALERVDVGLDIDAEFDTLLPRQAPNNTRLLSGVIRMTTARWSGLALSEAEVAAIHVEDDNA